MDGVDGISIVLGATTTGFLVRELLAWLRSRNQKTEISPTPLAIEKNDKFVTRGEFNAHVADNARDHENLFARLNANDKMTSKLDGILTTILTDVQDIKRKLFKTR